MWILLIFTLLQLTIGGITTNTGCSCPFTSISYTSRPGILYSQTPTPGPTPSPFSTVSMTPRPIYIEITPSLTTVYGKRGE